MNAKIGVTKKLYFISGNGHCFIQAVTVTGEQIYLYDYISCEASVEKEHRRQWCKSSPVWGYVCEGMAGFGLVKM